MPSPFASRVTKTIPIAFDPPNTVTIQKLRGRHHERAELAAQATYIEDMDLRGGVDGQKKALAMFNETNKLKDEPEKKEPDDKKPADPLAGLDHYTICRFGIAAWTYPESLEEDSETKRVTAIDDMDAESMKWFATEVMRITSPRLFESVDERKESEKNDSAA